MGSGDSVVVKLKYGVVFTEYIMYLSSFYHIYYHFKSLRTCNMFVITHIFHVHVFIVMYRFSYALYAHMK